MFDNPGRPAAGARQSLNAIHPSTYFRLRSRVTVSLRKGWGIIHNSDKGINFLFLEKH
jgi:hypothetical protein